MRMCGIYLIYIHAYTRSKVKAESGKVESDSVILVLSVYNPHGINFVYASCDLSLLVLAMFNY